MIYRLVVRARFVVQVIVLNLSFAAHRRPTASPEGWVVGPYEIAGIVYQLAKAVPGARSVVLARHPFFAFDYDWAPSARQYPGAGTLRAWLLGPWKLGELARSSVGFVYVSAEGFVNAAHDQRDYEFRFLKRHGLRIVTYFTGNDIRSPRLMRELEVETGRPNLGTYLPEINRVFASAGYDDAKRAIATVANRYADVVFNADLDQRAYLARPSEPFEYFHPDSEVTDDFSRFDDDGRLVVVHAPSSPVLKGTPLVRAAVDQLRSEGYDFDYVELSGVSHDVVVATLARAHIALNEFYSYVPGVFGVEAMAAGCALLTSADETLDRQLPKGSNAAWSVTEHFRIAERLRELLDDRERARALAVAGRDWVRRNAVASVTGARVEAILSEVTAGARPSMLILSFSEIAIDARVLKQVREFAPLYRLTTCGFGEAPLEGIEHLRVDGPRTGWSRGILRFPLAAIDLVATRFNRYGWTYERIPYVAAARRQLRGRRFDFAIANDVDAVSPTLDATRPGGVHADLHEFFPGIHDTSTPLGRRQTGYLTWLLRRYTPRAASWTTVGAGIAEAYRAYGLECEVVTNATPRFDLTPTPVDSSIRLVHSGNAQPSRQLELIMRAAAQTTADVSLDLYLMPNDTVYLAELTALASELGDRVAVRDPLPQSELVAALNAYDVGMHVLPPTSFNNANALPNKFFDYVQSRLGLIIGPSPEMARTLAEYGFGAVSADFTVDAVRAVLDELTADIVAGWKLNSDLASDALSADAQVAVWVRAIDRLARR